MNKLTICSCKRGSKVDPEKLDTLITDLKSHNVAFTLFEDLCGQAAKQESIELNLSDKGKNIMLGCQPKALKNLLEKSGIDTTQNNFDFRLLNETTLADLKINDIEQGNQQTVKYREDWKPWFPVLDYSLCTNCQKCLNFCLFGVYKLNDDGKVIVENPENCKDLCPACARTCPTNAIVFPKHHDSPIDGGEGEMATDSENFLEDIQNNQDVYKILANRRKASGVSLFKADQFKIAQQEREQCACKNNKK